MGRPQPHQRLAALAVTAVVALLIAPSAGAVASSARAGATVIHGAAGHADVSPSWDALGDNWLRDVKALSPNDVWIVGSRPSGNFYGPVVRHFDGTGFRNMPPIQTHCYPTSIDGLADNDMWLTCADSLTGQPLIEHWDGIEWTLQNIDQVGTFANLWQVWVDTSSDVWAVGDRYSGQSSQGLILHYDGHSWTDTQLPGLPRDTRLFGVSGTSAQDVWAVGFANGSADRTLTLHYDGHRWTEVASLDSNILARLESVTAISPDDVWATGTCSCFVHSSGILLHWDGRTWEDVSAPVLRKPQLFGITAVTTDDVWAVGSAEDRPFAAHWDGVKWRSVPPRHPKPGGEERLMAVSADGPDDVWAAGYAVSRTGNHWARMYQRWDGTRWTRDYP